MATHPQPAPASATGHPVRGPEWDRAEDAYQALLTALGDYRRALAVAGVEPDAMVVQHLNLAQSHLDFASP